MIWPIYCIGTDGGATPRPGQVDTGPMEDQPIGESLKGHYTSHYLAEILRFLYFDEATGILELRSPDGSQVHLHFERGMLYFATGSDPKTHLSTHLSSANVLPESVIKRLKEKAASGVEMAYRLVETGTVTKGDLTPAIRSLLECSVTHAFSWPSGFQNFTPAESSNNFFDPDILFTFECILRGIESMVHFEPLKKVLLGLQGRLKLIQNGFIPVQRLALKPHHGYILSRIDGSMRLEQISLLLPPGEEDEALRFLYGLAVLGIVEFDPPVNEGAFSLRTVLHGHLEVSAQEERQIAFICEAAARFMSQTAEEIFGPSDEVDHAAARAAFERIKAKYRKDQFSERVRQKCKKELNLIEKRLTEAFLGIQVEQLERTGRPDPSVELDPKLAVVRKEMVKTEAQAAKEQTEKLSEQYYQKARAFLAEKDFHNCVQFCRLAIKFNDQAAGAYVLMASALRKNPSMRWQKMAEDALLKAVDLDPWNAEYRVALATFYKDHGLDSRARKQFEKAVEILPSHPVANEALRGSRR